MQTECYPTEQARSTPAFRNLASFTFQVRILLSAQGRHVHGLPAKMGYFENNVTGWKRIGRRLQDFGPLLNCTAAAMEFFFNYYYFISLWPGTADYQAVSGGEGGSHDKWFENNNLISTS